LKTENQTIGGTIPGSLSISVEKSNGIS